MIKSKTHIRGFEDYNIVYLSDYCLYTTGSFYVPYSYTNNASEYLINKNLPVAITKDVHPQYGYCQGVIFSPKLCIDHKELLNDAKKVYVHQCCKISRSLIAEKYKKSLNPHLADAVVIPNPGYKYCNLCKKALFINEDAHMIVMINLDNDGSEYNSQSFKEGDKLKDLTPGYPDMRYASRIYSYDVSEMMQAELFYVGDVLEVPNTHSYIIDLLTGVIPADKTVFENTIQNSLGNETNQLDFDSLTSIVDMLNSSDENTVAAGLKSLSMMDWIHYPQSVKFALNNTNSKSNWIYNKACDSTSVKYMMRTLSGGCVKRTVWPGNYDHDIYEKDFELFKQLKCHYHHIDSADLLQHIRNLDFIGVDSEGRLIPIIKPE